MNMQLQSPNANMGPSPFMLAPQETEEAGFDFWGVLRRRKWLVFLGLLTGLFVGGIYNSQCQKVYESKATVTISPKQKQIFKMGNGEDYDDAANFDFRHDQLIGEDNILTQCLIKYDLKGLETLRDKSPTDQIKSIQDDLVVSQNRDESTKYELNFQSLNPRDAQTVLATVVSTYEKHLNEKYRRVTSDTMELLKKMSSRFQNERNEIDSKLAAAKDKAEALKIAGKSEHITRIITELMNKIDLEKAELSKLTSYLARTETALENGRESVMEHLWILEDAEEIRSGALEISDNSERIASQIKIIEDLELARDQLILIKDYGPGHREVQAYNLAINEREKKIKELKSEGVQITGIAPEQILQRYIVGIKQQIGDIRLTLSSHLKSYRENYEKAVSSERAIAEVEELRLAREKVVDKLRCCRPANH